MSLPIHDEAFLAFFKNTPLEVQAKVIEEAAPAIEPDVTPAAEEPYLKETELIIQDAPVETNPSAERPRRPRRNL